MTVTIYFTSITLYVSELTEYVFLPKNTVFLHKNNKIKRINMQWILQLTNNQPITKQGKNCRFLERRRSW